MRTVAIIQARMTSTRLPGKVLERIGAHTMLEHVIARARRIDGVDEVCVAVPDTPASDVVAEHARNAGALVVRGSEDDVLARTTDAARATSADVVVRITSDCPLLDPRASSTVVAARRASGCAYARTAFDHGYPHGFDTEAITRDALEIAFREATDAYEREHVTPFIWRRPDRFAAVHVDRVPDRRAWRLTVDTAEDLALARAVFDALGPSTTFGLEELERLFAARPDLLALNESVPKMAYVGLPRA